MDTEELKEFVEKDKNFIREGVIETWKIIYITYCFY
jgi:hypothetical protein